MAGLHSEEEIDGKFTQAGKHYNGQASRGGRSPYYESAPPGVEFHELAGSDVKEKFLKGEHQAIYAFSKTSL
ncbi:MAG TPA: hypothetical protein VFX01_02885 [Methylophilaceae bacterium]|nr:hypothetical protein [Methylophilaceae bacterium]